MSYGVLKKFDFDFKKAFTGKTVAGESAGANCLSTFCYSKSGGGIIKGLGLVPVKMIPHYNNEHKKELYTITDNLETLLLPNYQFKVFNI